MDPKRLRELCEKATPGPWGTAPFIPLSDAEFIIAAREALPALMDRLEELEAQNKILADDIRCGDALEKELEAKLKSAEKVVEVMKGALKEIKIGRGPYSHDRLEHATGTIQAMKEEASKALAAFDAMKKETPKT